ncbi:hypothetical protein D3C72_1761460 [compost metagenome]
MQRDIEVGVVADAGGRGVFGAGLRDQQRLDLGAQGGAFAQRARQRQAQGAPVRLAQGHQGVQAVGGARGKGVGGQAFERLPGSQRGQVQDLVADGHAGAEGFLRALAAERGVGQVLHREIRRVRIGASDPALEGRVVGFVDRGGHGCVSLSVWLWGGRPGGCLGAPDQAKAKRR